MNMKESLISEGARLLRPFWPIVVFATAMGTLSGLATAWLLATINRALYTEGDVTSALLWTFVGLVALTLSGEIVSDLGNSFIGQQVIASLRKELVAKVVAAPIDRLEIFKTHRLLSVLSQDVDAVSSFSYGFSALAIAIAVTIGCAAYLLFLSPTLFAIVAIAITFGVFINKHARQLGAAFYDQARTAQDDVFKNYRAITEGAKELRLNRARRHRVQHENLVGAIDLIRDKKVQAFRIFMSASAAESALFFIVIGIIIGWQRFFNVDHKVVSGFVLVLLYVKGPLGQALSAYGAFVNAQVSFNRIARLSADFANPEPFLSAEAAPAGSHVRRDRIDTIALRDASYAFPSLAGKDGFCLGPLTLEIRRGEILFIVGENGCGKTTLVKLLLGLYQPQAGCLLLDGEPVRDAARDDYRQLFSTIFFDYFLFDDLIIAEERLAATASNYLEKLEIAHKVAIENSAFTTTDLSTGQRKRLALVHVYLEGRPVIVFDEWAAEQDPTFRKVFYEEILHDLKSQGKTLIVVSHDDRYFHVADRVVCLENGKIVGDRLPRPALVAGGDA